MEVKNENKTFKNRRCRTKEQFIISSNGRNNRPAISFSLRKFNPGLVCTEMVSAKALFYGDEKTKTLLNTEGEKRPIAVQIFGSDVESMKYATKYVSNIADIIDINMGCPAPKIVKMEMEVNYY